MRNLKLAKSFEKNARIACNRMEASSVYTGSEIGGFHVCIISGIRRLISHAASRAGKSEWYALEVSGIAEAIGRLTPAT